MEIVTLYRIQEGSDYQGGFFKRPRIEEVKCLKINGYHFEKIKEVSVIHPIEHITHTSEITGESLERPYGGLPSDYFQEEGQAKERLEHLIRIYKEFCKEEIERLKKEI